MMRRVLAFIITGFFLSACAEVELLSDVAKKTVYTERAASAPSPIQQGTFKIGKPYQVDGRWYYPKEQYELTETGIASWYGPGFNGKRTASGETFDSSELTAAHRTLQMPSLVRVTNLGNGRSVIVRVNDRGPYKRGRVMDVSSKAADLLGFKGAGTAKIKLEVLPQESMKIAQIAKTGVNTKGYELAMNETGRAPVFQPRYEQVAYDSSESMPLQPVTRETISAPVEGSPGINSVIPGHTRDGQFYPDPVVTEMPVTPSNIYVQAGAFSVYDNALHLRDRLSAYNEARVYPATVRGQNLFRVRLGPVASVEEADELLARLVESGQREAIIVVE